MELWLLFKDSYIRMGSKVPFLVSRLDKAWNICLGTWFWKNSGGTVSTSAKLITSE
ncbi:hypothetical protein OVS_00120 [Mycoplasma ovis str. Michigan]|uniref:Uncharacterized protein n=1 Tax=Mycoplasma ovis str. Michigan TaxID=1415773 RepID=A0ABM5P129_9MOLU|nr:hypothetical protein OVS_00120 [Mycoplasma ovis str. Michigan]